MAATEKRHRILALMLAVLFVGYYGGSLLCQHVHYVGDVMVVNSHPYSNISHTHSQDGLQALSLLNGSLLYTFAEAAATVVAAVVVMLLVAVVVAIPIAVKQGGVALRAPPVID